MDRKRGNSMGRRDFLVLGSTGIMAPAFLGWSPLSRTSASEADPAVARLSVGYWRGSDAHPDLSDTLSLAAGDETLWGSDPLRPDVLPAEELPRGDDELLRAGVRVTIHGMVGNQGTWLGPDLEALSVTLHFRPVDGGETRTLPFSAWHYQRSPVPMRSASVSNVVPLDREWGLRLSVDRNDGENGPLGRTLDALLLSSAAEATPGPASEEVRFTVGREPGRPRLRRGVYFLASMGRSQAGPAWGRYQFRAAGEGPGRGLVRPEMFGPQPADFDYLVLSVDHAASGDRA
jgi:hypothetical protein